MSRSSYSSPRPDHPHAARGDRGVAGSRPAMRARESDTSSCGGPIQAPRQRCTRVAGERTSRWGDGRSCIRTDTGGACMGRGQRNYVAICCHQTASSPSGGSMRGKGWRVAPPPPPAASSAWRSLRRIGEGMPAQRAPPTGRCRRPCRAPPPDLRSSSRLAVHSAQFRPHRVRCSRRA
jgi:hypothetical protein